MDSEISTSEIVLSAAATSPNALSESTPLGTALCLAAFDIVAVTCALCAASALRNTFFPNPAPPSYGTLISSLVVVMCSFTLAGLYPGVSMNPIEEIRICTISITLAFVSLWTGTLFLHDLSQSRFVSAVAFVFALVLVPFFRSCARQAFSKRSWWGTPVAIIGFGQTGKLLLNSLTSTARIGMKPIVVFDKDPKSFADFETRIACQPLSRCREFVRHHKISYAIVCMPDLSREEMLELLDEYRHCFRHIVVIPNLIGMSSLGTCAREIGGIVGLEVTRHLLRPSARFLKRASDFVITLAVAPLVIALLALFAILIKLEDGGPIFYSNRRIGHKCKPFKAWKLRSMVTDGDKVLQAYLANHPAENAHWQATQKLKRDPRLTRVGRIIRKTSIDEMPQFWNVFVGEMSLVGPRPILENQIALYGSAFSLYQEVRPGMTGLWQISGRNHLTFAERVNLDKYVIENWSVWLDLYILARTAEAVLGGKGAY